MEKRPQKNTTIQLIWGAALTVVGIGVFIRIPQVMPKLEQMDQFSGAMGFVRFCLYLMGVILIGGGIKKIVHYFRSVRTNHVSASETDQVEKSADR